jgi:hypothetical protein
MFTILPPSSRTPSRTAFHEGRLPFSSSLLGRYHPEKLMRTFSSAIPTSDTAHITAFVSSHSTSNHSTTVPLYRGPHKYFIISFPLFDVLLLQHCQCIHFVSSRYCYSSVPSCYLFVTTISSLLAVEFPLSLYILGATVY